MANILVVDDEEGIRKILRQVLEYEGHEVRVASGGGEAIEAYVDLRPDLVFMDVKMARMDGLEVCRRLKADPATRLTPVVLVTGQSDLSDRIRGIEAGADEFLSKPKWQRFLILFAGPFMNIVIAIAFTAPR